MRVAISRSPKAASRSLGVLRGRTDACEPDRHATGNCIRLLQVEKVGLRSISAAERKSAQIFSNRTAPLYVRCRTFLWTSFAKANNL
jgi:hypothetical protein